MTTRKKITKNEAARLGGLARYALHGNFGTAIGRRLGGLHSIQTHIKDKTGFVIRKNITIPEHSVELAELFGILAGDGHIGKYQITMTTNLKTDFSHAQYVQKLCERLFKVAVPLRKRQDKNVSIVVLSSRSASEFLCREGLTQGNKVTAQLAPPEWILKNLEYKKAFLRGLFDTDGCVFFDKHKIRGREYRNMGTAFTNRSFPLLDFYKKTLESLGLSPTQKTQYVVFLRRREHIRRYFDMVGSSNRKHLDRVNEFLASKEAI